MKYKYKYLVAYDYKSGCGSSVITFYKKIRSEKDVEHITKFIEEKNHIESVAIKNFILMDKKWGFGEWLVAIAELSLLVFCILSMIASIFG